MELVLEGGDHAKIPAPAAEAPEQIGVLGGTRGQKLAFGCHHIADRRLSQVSPYLPASQPRPPPRVSPAMPVSETWPPVVARPNAWVSRSKSPHVAPLSARAVRRMGSTRTLRIWDRSSINPLSHTALP